jgi:hypothetical protein
MNRRGGDGELNTAERISLINPSKILGEDLKNNY